MSWQHTSAGVATADVEFDLDLIRKYDTPAPRYTSYPTAADFRGDFTASDLRREIVRVNAEERRRPLSLYFHIPFCDTVCFYCACNKVVTRNRAHSHDYLQRLFRELSLMGHLVGEGRTVEQLHWGGGTPTFLSSMQMRALMDHARRHFQLLDEDAGEYGIEIDPRRLEEDTLDVLRELGFNRLSMGVQDLDPAVQEAVNRVQPAEETFAVLSQAREVGFRSVSVDLMYGLPRQTSDSFERTLDAVVAARPDRLSIFNYAHLPERFKTQRQIREEELPDAAVKLEILRRTIETLQDAGYVYIGMDHFALHNDEMAVALRKGTLHRNFQGYSTHADCELVAMGASSISQVGQVYAQNAHKLDDYYDLIDQGELATVRGIELNSDDLVRREVISSLMCRFALRFDDIEKRYHLLFKRYFGHELELLAAMADDGLVELEPRSVRVTAKGRLLIRNIAMVFDAYRRTGSGATRFSRAI
jgi:oxygen-independent coproporphyrinogen-3 oxidase